jgi:hypothetical protein
VAKTLGFVALNSLKKPGAQGDPAEALAELRRIYFKTTPRTIDHDFAHAIELAKSITSEREREKASVFMEGINELRKEWEPKRTTSPRGSRGHGPGQKKKR